MDSPPPFPRLHEQFSFVLEELHEEFYLKISIFSIIYQMVEGLKLFPFVED